MKLSISEHYLIQFIQDRIANANADELCRYAETIFGADSGSITHSNVPEQYELTTEQNRDDLCFDYADMLRYGIKIEEV